MGRNVLVSQRMITIEGHALNFAKRLQAGRENDSATWPAANRRVRPETMPPCAAWYCAGSAMHATLQKRCTIANVPVSAGGELPLPGIFI